MQKNISQEKMIERVIKEIRTEGIDWDSEQPHEKKLTEILEKFADWVLCEW